MVDDDFSASGIESDETTLVSHADFYAYHLRRAGFLVRTLSDPDQALTAVVNSEIAFDLVILDMMMPAHPESRNFPETLTNGGMTTGLRLAEMIRQVRPNQPIAFLSALYRYAESMKDVSCFGKPMSPWELVQAVSSLLNAGEG